MYPYYDEKTIVHFQDLRILIQDEFRKFMDELNAKEKKKVKTESLPLDIGEVAERYGVVKATVHNWMNRKIIKGFKMGKGRFFHLEELEKNLKQFGHLDVLPKKKDA